MPWAPPPMEGKGPKEWQRTAIGQYAPPAADKNNIPWRHANPPPPPAVSSSWDRLFRDVNWMAVGCLALITSPLSPTH